MRHRGPMNHAPSLCRATLSQREVVRFLAFEPFISCIRKERQMSSKDPSYSIVPFFFVTVVGANILSMSLMNFFESDTRYTTLIYLACAVPVALLFYKSSVGFPQLTKKEHLFCLGLGAALLVPRLPYLFEGTLGFAMIPLGDDLLHLQEMLSIVHTPQFPPKSTFDETKYLSYYYAPWMLSAAFYGTKILSSVKQALALTSLTYCIFSSYAVVYASKVLFRERKLQLTFVVICILYGGFDFVYWLCHLSYVPEHSEGWAEDFGFILEYSNYFTLSLWVQQHFQAALSVIFVLYLIVASETHAAAALGGLLMLAATFSSPFVVLGAAPMLAWTVLRYNRLRFIPVAAAVFSVLSVPLWWIFLGRHGATGFKAFGDLVVFWKDKKVAAFLVFLLVISLELMLLVAAALHTVRRRAGLVWPFALAVAFLLSTYFVSFGAGQNYSMRGSIVSIFVLSYLATPTLNEWWNARSPRWLTVALSTYFLGGILEYTWFVKNSVDNLLLSNNKLNMAALDFNRNKIDANDLERVKAQFSKDYGDLSWYFLERKGGHRAPDPDQDPLNAETMNDDVGYRVTAAWVRRRVSPSSSSVRSGASASSREGS